MGIGKTVYLIQVLNNVRAVSDWLSVVTFGVILIAVFAFVRISLDMYDDEDYKITRSNITKILKVSFTALALCILVQILIPESKTDMYVIAFTKDYTAEDVYSMTKEEVKGVVDYLVESIEKVKSE